MKSYKDFKDCEVVWFKQLPTHWHHGQLKFWLLSNDGGVWGKDYSNNSEKGAIVLRSTEISVDGKWQIDNPAVRLLTEKEKEKAKLKAGDLLITKSSGSESHIGKTALVTQEIENLSPCFSNFMQRVRPSDGLNSRFLYYFLNSFISREQFNYFSTTTSGLANLNSEIIGSLRLTCPPLPEQQTIANFLDCKTAQIDTLIAKKQRQIELLQEYRAALINQAITKGLDLNVPMKDLGVDWLGEIPENWSFIPLKFFGEITLGKMLTPTRKGGYIEKPYLRAKNIGWESVIHIDDIKTMWFSPNELEKYRLNKDDLLISEGGEVGRTAIWNNELDECYIQNSVHKVTLNNKQVPLYFLYQSQLFGKKGYYDSIVSKVSISHLTYEKLKEIRFIVPPTEEQHAIASFLKHKLKNIDHLIQLTNKEIFHIQEYKQSLTFCTVTGKIDVRDQG